MISEKMLPHIQCQYIYVGHHHILQSQPRVRRYWEERVIYEAESLIDAIAALHDDRCRM